MGYVKDAVFPRRCLCCDKVVKMGKTPSFCEDCLKSLIEYDYELSDDPFQKVLAKYLYEDTAAFIIKKVKHSENKAITDWIGDELTSLVRDKIGGKFDLIVGVPRYGKDGGGYSSSQSIAKRIAENLHCKYGSGAIEKVKKTKSQTACKEMSERFTNVEGAFRLCENVEGLIVLVVDDTLTSGATMNEVGKVLSEGGAYCFGVAFAKTKMHGTVLGKFNPDYEIISKESVFYPFSKARKQVNRYRKRRALNRTERKLNNFFSEKRKQSFKKLFKKRKNK